MTGDAVAAGWQGLYDELNNYRLHVDRLLLWTLPRRRAESTAVHVRQVDRLGWLRPLWSALCWLRGAIRIAVTPGNWSALHSGGN